MNTNRDLYKAVEALILEKKDATSVPLQEYLINLRNAASGYSQQPALTLEQFLLVLRDAFTPQAVSKAASGERICEGYEAWRLTVEQQIRDLAEMAATGQLESEMRYFGIDAPSGQRWYNFDPCSYIECGLAGAFGGWEDGDATGRSYVPGMVAYVADDGSIKSCNPRELAQPPESITCITWQMFSEFSWCGQNYE